MARKKTVKKEDIKKEDMKEDIVDEVDEREEDIIEGEEIEETTQKETKKKTTKKKKKKKIIDSDAIDDVVSETMSSASGAWSWIEDNRQQLLGAALMLLALYFLRDIVFGVVLLIAGLLLVTGYFEDED